MAQDTEYKSYPYIYRSVGLAARPILDRAPEFSYLDMRNCLEREEGSMSSRYGNQILNRDPNGTPSGQNYYFSEPVVSLARLTFQNDAYRYAETSDGQLWRRVGNAQGQYSSIYAELSGDPFASLVTSCYETSQPYIFIYDSDASIKDNGTLASPQLTGIDPSPYTATTQPYSPLLTMIDNFATGSSYTTSDVTDWVFGNVTTLAATSGQAISDFSEFFGIQQSGSDTYALGSTTVTVYSTGANYSPVLSGFTSRGLSPGESISVSVNVDASVTVLGSGVGTASFQYSSDNGATWTSFYGFSSTLTQSWPAQNQQITITGIANLDTVEFRVYGEAAAGPDSGSSVTGTINSVVATVNSPGVFGPAVNGMLATLSTNNSTPVSIVSIVSSGLSSGLYTSLTITTQAAHGLSATDYCSVYGSSNPLADGFYTVASAPTSTTLVVNILNPLGAPINATGGTLWPQATGAPANCVLNSLYSSPYPPQMSAWGVYWTVAPSTTSFPVGSFSGTVAESTVGTVGKTVTLDLSQNNQVTDDDLIVLILQVGTPANMLNVRVMFDVDGSGYTSSWYYKDVSPSYYQGGVSELLSAYSVTQQQILANALNLISGQTPGSTAAQLQPANFSTGSGAWQAVYLRRGDFVPVGTAGQQGFNWANITGWQVQFTTSSAGSSAVALNGLYLQWGYGPSSFAGVGYDYRYTFYNFNTGTESNGNPAQNFNLQFGYLPTLTKPIFLRQAGLIAGYYSADPQVTHIRIYRRGGVYNDNWRQIDQILNITGTGLFAYKDVIADSAIQQAQTLVLDNDPPVTSSLVTPVNTTLAAATVNLQGNTAYQPAVPAVQTVAVQSGTFVANQIVLVGNSNNLEEVRIVTGGTNQVTATFELSHNAGEPVICYSTPRALCNICCLANDGTVYLAGDENNPQRIYRSKPNNPESFGPQDYTDVSAADDAVMAIINWRGTIVAATLKTWYLLPPGASKPVPTGAAHGLVGTQAWTLAEGGIWFRSTDGLRFFTGADGNYMSLPIEWIYQGNPLCIPPQAYQPDISQDVLAFYNNSVFDAYISNNAGAAGPIYRTIWSTVYKRFRYDDVPATAMLWEQDTNAFLVAKEMSAGNYAIVQDWVGDYDDGGWVSGALAQTPINLVIQLPYLDLNDPHNPKNWTSLETDCNTQGQAMATQLLFDDQTIPSITLPTITTTQRTKVQSPVTPSGANEGSGQQAYRASIQHTIQVTTAPILFQENIYAAVLAAFRFTFDTYWLLSSTDGHKLAKEIIWSYSSTQPVNCAIFADDQSTPYYTFTLPAEPSRATLRTRFPALKMRQWRMIGNIASGQAGFQAWKAPQLHWKRVLEGSSYQEQDLVT